MTIWPGAVPLPAVPVRKEHYRLHETGLALIGTSTGGEFERRGRLGEVYLDLYALDLEDPQEIVAFANRYAPPNGLFVYALLGRSQFYANLFSVDDDRRVREAVRASDPQLRRQMDHADRDFDPFLIDVEPLETVRYAAHVLRDLTTTWRLLSADPSLEASPRRWELNYTNEDNLEPQLFALMLLSLGLNVLLTRFQLQLGPTPEPKTTREIQLEERLRPLPITGVLANVAETVTSMDLAEYCALELFNHIAGSEAYRVCRNCGRLFIRQYGRAEHGQSRRQGVLYCSRHCAQAVAAREYRRRKQARSQTSPT
jgi:hypothetical protein